VFGFKQEPSNNALKMGMVRKTAEVTVLNISRLRERRKQTQSLATLERVARSSKSRASSVTALPNNAEVTVESASQLETNAAGVGDSRFSASHGHVPR
jgi:hypothetical protein